MTAKVDTGKGKTDLRPDEFGNPAHCLQELLDRVGRLERFQRIVENYISDSTIEESRGHEHRLFLLGLLVGIALGFYLSRQRGED